MKIRVAQPSDGYRISYVRVESWKTTYRGLVPDSYLENLSVEKDVERRTKMIVQALNNEDNLILVAENDEGEVIGYAAGRKYESEEYEYDCEISMIYLLLEYQGKGIGTNLSEKLIDFLISRGFITMIVWVMQGNPACLFYEKLDGKLKERFWEEKRGTRSEILGYVWEDIRIIFN